MIISRLLLGLRAVSANGRSRGHRQDTEWWVEGERVREKMTDIKSALQVDRRKTTTKSKVKIGSPLQGAGCNHCFA